MSTGERNLILICDPNRNSGLVLSSRLAAWGYATELFGSVEDLLTFLTQAKSTPDLILVDLSENDPRGIQIPTLVQEKTSWGKAVPIVAHTALSDPKFVRLAMKSGFVDYIIRPTETEVLQDRIKNLVSKQPGLSNNTVIAMVREKASAVLELEIEQFNEFGAVIATDVEFAVHSSFFVKSDLFSKIDLPTVKVRVAFCEAKVGDPSKYVMLVNYVGLNAVDLRKLRGHAIRFQTEQFRGRVA